MITTDPNEYVRQLSLSNFRFANWAEFDFANEANSTVAGKLSDKLPPSSPSRWPELMSISTLSEYLDMSSASIRTLISQGVLPEATTAPTPRLKRWKRSVVDETLQRIADRRVSYGLSMNDALMSQNSRAKGGR